MLQLKKKSIFILSIRNNTLIIKAEQTIWMMRFLKGPKRKCWTILSIAKTLNATWNDVWGARRQEEWKSKQPLSSVQELFTMNMVRGEQHCTCCPYSTFLCERTVCMYNLLAWRLCLQKSNKYTEVRDGGSHRDPAFLSKCSFCLVSEWLKRAVVTC